MDAFIQRHQQDVIGVLEGCDRMRFRSPLRSVAYATGLDLFLTRVGVRYKDFKEAASEWSNRFVEHARQVTRQAGRPDERHCLYLYFLIRQVDLGSG